MKLLEILQSQLVELREELKALRQSNHEIEKTLAAHTADDARLLAEFRADKATWKSVFDRLLALSAILISLAALIVNLMKHN